MFTFYYLYISEYEGDFEVIIDKGKYKTSI